MHKQVAFVFVKYEYTYHLLYSANVYRFNIVVYFLVKNA